MGNKSERYNWYQDERSERECKHGVPLSLTCYQCENERLERRLESLNDFLHDVGETRDEIEAILEENGKLVDKACEELSKGLVSQAIETLKGFKRHMDAPRDVLMLKVRD